MLASKVLYLAFLLSTVLIGSTPFDDYQSQTAAILELLGRKEANRSLIKVVSDCMGKTFNINGKSQDFLRCVNDSLHTDDLTNADDIRFILGNYVVRSSILLYKCYAKKSDIIYCLKVFGDCLPLLMRNLFGFSDYTRRCRRLIHMPNYDKDDGYLKDEDDDYDKEYDPYDDYDDDYDDDFDDEDLGDYDYDVDEEDEGAFSDFLSERAKDTGSPTISVKSDSGSRDADSLDNSALDNVALGNILLSLDPNFTHSNVDIDASQTLIDANVTQDIDDPNRAHTSIDPNFTHSNVGIDDSQTVNDPTGTQGVNDPTGTQGVNDPNRTYTVNPGVTHGPGAPNLTYTIVDQSATQDNTVPDPILPDNSSGDSIEVLGPDDQHYQ
ncbi:hypothetical protein TpMuguga_01g00914 [Theileria parva strain Muguga]|uniref:Uncharacterized protein n=1 Tax=Theileria parva TaxID=5875 RepID=Q4N7A6_THEPA|nr:uncharacterized protein TpMuguga_01g00914 [Theileria parva strain Muguga]EAN34152.1 hypothetical protein TpMuguga_01g00914 [Theileria parva strain Muguga]|eukprot:XP_766435.1 hypothetical protein [Theileria parva strain Muguga]